MGIMTPSDIEILIHCACCPGQHPRYDAPAVYDSIKNMHHSGLLIEQKPGFYKTTDKGNAHLTQLCNLPLPKQVFVDKNGDEIK